MQEQPTPVQEQASELESSSLSPSILAAALTPRGLFTNLFPITFASPSLGTLKQARKAQKEDFSDRKRPSFYQSGEVLYAYGSGLEEFKDVRFTSGIVPVNREPDFARHLLKLGLANWFSDRGYLVRFRRVGISVIDHNTSIAEAESGFLHIFPEFTFQSYLVEGAAGTPIYCFSIEPAWATVPVFEVGPRVRSRGDLLHKLKVVIRCPECVAHCPLYDSQDREIGVFHEFAEDGSELTTACACENYIPQPVRVHQRKWRKGKLTEQTHVVPGQVIRPAAGQRRVLKLFKDRGALEREGRVWLGDLTRGGSARAGALQVRFERIQYFLARAVGSATGALPFALPTGPRVEIQRVPLTVEEVIDA